MPILIPQDDVRGNSVPLTQHQRRFAHTRDLFRGKPYQSLAIGFCVLFAAAMILNTQMSGEVLWFFYARLLHSGTKLYADLHFALQPLFVLENDIWIKLFGTKTFVTELPSILHALALSVGFFLALQQSDWPDWQKAIILTAAFLLSVEVSSYRFDDFHVTADIFSLYSLVALLWLAKARTLRRSLILAAWLGVLSGLTITTRLNDGVALLVATLVSLLFLARTRKTFAAVLFLFAAALTVAVVVRLTGDSFSAYVSNSILGAAATKGVGKTSILIRPWLLFTNSLHIMRHARKWLLVWIMAIAAAGAFIARVRKSGIKYIVPVQLCIAAAGFIYSSPSLRAQLLTGTFVNSLSVACVVAAYLLAPLVAARYLNSKSGFGKNEWDAREILVLLPLALMASLSASTGGEADVLFLHPHAMLLLLIPVIQPFRKYAVWANPTFATVMILLAITCMSAKIYTPYSWNYYIDSPMFQNRQWYRHPVYGPMYIDRDLLNFVLPVCNTINLSGTHPELLSLPYSYANYFCATPPWHGYVQTFFDTSSRATINHLMQELNTAPPQWIVYQRQLKILAGAEQNYNQGKPLAHRDLDTLIMNKIATHQWQLVDKVSYLPDDDWFIIKTRP